MIRKYVVKIGKESFEVEVEEIKKQNQTTVAYSNIVIPPVVTSALPTPAPKFEGDRRAPVAAGKTVTAMMSGSIIAILVKEGDTVAENDVVIKLEAMKMETVVNTPFAGKVKQICVKERQAVQAGEVLIVME